MKEQLKSFEQEKAYRAYFWYDDLQIHVEKIFPTLQEARDYVKHMKLIFNVDIEFGIMTLYPTPKPQLQQVEQQR